MSKQAKLAALIDACKKWNANTIGHHIKQVEFGLQAALADYMTTPDDPPQPPEMPECVAKLCGWVEVETCGLSTTVKAVRDHYAQPLKLEVGKVYVDDRGEHVKVLWKNHNNHEFLAVSTKTDAIRYYDHRGVCSNVPSNLIREVTP